jgi:hypothetical protein
VSAILRQKGAILLCGAFLASSGCAIIPFRHRAPNPIVPVPQATATDTLVVIPPAPPDTLEPVSQAPSTHRHPHPPPKPPAPADSSQHSESPPEPPPAQAAPDRSISIEMPGALRTQLEASYQTDLTSTEKTVTLLAERRLAQADLDKLQTVTGLLSQARAAFDQQDLQAAANLVHKARVLADEIASH